MAERWMQAASESMEKRGTKGSYGHHSMKQINRDIKKGGKIGKKAQFAKAARKGKKGRGRGRG